MRRPLVRGREALRLRMRQPQQVGADAPEAGMPPYMDSFLAHLRLLIGVPFENLVPDPRLLPDESIRFFYLDRAWTDRLVDGALAVGQVGSREQAHYHGHAPAVSQQLDQSERMVRSLQRRAEYTVARRDVMARPRPADTITGFVLRSAAVAGWPHMDVRAYSLAIPEVLDASLESTRARQLARLRIERLGPAVLLALFEGVPELVVLEEPHHGVQFGVKRQAGALTVPLRDGRGALITSAGSAIQVTVPTRSVHAGVVRVQALRDAIALERAKRPEADAVEQTGSAAFAISVLDPPWRQRFEGTQDKGGGAVTDLLARTGVSQTVRQARLRLSVERLMVEE